MTQHNNLTPPIRQTHPLHPDVGRWLEALDQQGRSRHTLAAYRRALSHFIQWDERTYGSAFNPGSIIPRDVRDWKGYQQTVEQAAPATINQRLVALTRFFAWAVNQGLTRLNPAEATGSLHLPVREAKGLPNKDLRRLLRAVHSSGHFRDIAIVEVLAGTGLRVGELLALQVGDLELGERSGKLTVRQGKHGGYRAVPLTREVRAALSAYLQHCAERDQRGTGLWVGIRGELSHRSSVVRLLNKYAYQAGIEEFNPHALRHTFATRYLEANPGDLRGLAALLGHANLNTVMHYTEPRLEDLAERMERVGLEE
jgi:site-specific recombinase XerC